VKEENPLTNAENTSEPKTTEKKAREKETLPETIAGLAGVLVGAMFILTFVIQQFEIPSSSMERTLLIGDHLFVDRLTPTGKKGLSSFLMPYREVHRGDIAVFSSPDEPGRFLVKRIVAVPGDRIHLDDGVVVLNGVRQVQPFVVRNGTYEPARDNFPAAGPAGYSHVLEWPATLRHNLQGRDLVIPPDSYFAMGDNRDDSFDSRFWGFVPRENILGSPLFIAWSLRQTASDFPEDASLAVRAGSFAKTAIHFFPLTRWDRVLHLVH
jgi:signal peptidase I